VYGGVSVFDAGDGRGAGASASGWRVVVRRWRWMLLVAALAAGVAAYVTAARDEPTYNGKAVLLVGPISGEIDTLRSAGQQAQTYAQLAISRPLLDATESKLKLPGVSREITASASEVTRLLTIGARHSDPVLAAKIANVHAGEVIAFAMRRHPRAGGPGQVQMVDPAEPEEVAVGPSAGLIALLAALAGLGGALGLALLLDRSGQSVSGKEDLKALTGVGFLGTLDKHAARRDRAGRTVLEAAPTSRAADQYRLLAAKLTAMGPRSLLVLSMEDDDGVVAANLAAALGASGARVALLDADETEVRMAGSRNGHPDVTIDDDVLVGEALVGRGAGAQVLARPATLPSSSGVVEQARRLLEELAAEHDLVVVHARPLGRSVSGLVWGRITDGTVLIAQRDRTAGEDLRTALESLELVNAPIIGTVLTTASGAPWQ
jgi:capsular polysaccharide biosynthesis protein/Mrp family chromosome partitioning ATPase